MRISAVSLLLGLVSAVAALSASGNRVLVITEDDADRAKYSQFLKGIEKKGFELEHHKPKDTGFSLFQHGVPAYDHLVLLPTKAKGLGAALSPKLIVDFINAGSNVLVTLSAANGVPIAVSSLLQEMDISLAPERESIVVDHFQYDTKSAGEAHDVLVLDGPKAQFFSVAEGAADGYLALPRPVGQVLGNASPLLHAVVKAPATAYIHDPKGDADAAEDSFATGSQISLVTAFQGRNSARVTVLGSAEALEDKWLDGSVKVQTPGEGVKAVAPRNKLFADKLVAWTFQEAGVLKTAAIRHWLAEGEQKGVANASQVPSLDVNPELYRIKNDVHYEIEMSEWNGESWVPFVVPAGDHLQLEFSMLSPFHRLNLQPIGKTATTTVFGADFKLPDQHGIFNFFVEYRRPGYTNVEEKRTVTVRHFAHDEWPRSFVISGAWPWISGIWVTVAGWLAFVALWLYSQPADEKKNLKKTS